MKNIVVYMGIGLIRLVSFLPLPAAHALGRVMGKLLWFTDNARIAKINLRISYPDLNDAEIESLARESLIALGKTYAEMGMSWMWPIPKVQKLITQVEGLEHLEKALSDKQGIILIAPHLGNWEVLNHFFRQHLFMTVMYKPAKIPALDNFIFSTRKRVDVGLVPADRSGVESLYQLLNDKGVVAVLPDQEPGLKSGVFAPFFGQTALTGKLIGELANNTSAFLLCCYAKRLENGNYGVVLKPAHDDIRNSDEVAAATALNASIEECINDCPEQYQWNYKRFRRQPEGRSNFYKK
ncbi:Bacterial lipid A biosynthesis acyltransferase [Oleispira antarctica RB-8]|uniref:Bacterial lipid A biosynthesis acyltransferase n=1 Tax=Oleispira antarctica RB-8 TaxID=698738 RepID=R4YTX3_OLEAN|nr:Bacterial lipid A biosynthesis acyltransferase [Oleispira antarctica RB-8]